MGLVPSMTDLTPNTPGLVDRLLRTAAAAALVGLACLLYAAFPHNGPLLAMVHGTVAFNFSGAEFLRAAAAMYCGLLLVFHLFLYHETGLTKSQRVFALAASFVRSPQAVWSAGLARADKTALLATLVKAYFTPMMVMWLMGASVEALFHGVAIAAEGTGAGWLDLFNRHGFWVLMKTIFFVDLLIFTVGYLVESPRLGNEIRSVEPTLLGWAAALLCYPPFNTVTGQVLGSQATEFPQFDDPTLHLGLNLLLLGLMAIYAWASVALGLKSSNLTHRGIIATGPYAFVRHPAYVCKNMAWWIGAVPAVSFAFDTSTWQGLLALASVTAWSMLYALRAITEERHLLGVDDDYAAYAARVRWRFIPGLH